MTNVLYIYHDEHVKDIQTDEALSHSVWKTAYDPLLDVWHVWTPSGLYREYRRHNVPQPT